MESAPDKPAPQRCRGLTASAHGEHEWERHREDCRQKQLRRRAVLALAVISEPLQLEWREVFMDTAWSAWVELIHEARRSKELPGPQHVFESLRGGTLHRCGTASFSEQQMQALLQQVAPDLLPGRLAALIRSMPRNLSGHVSVGAFFDWLYESSAEHAKLDRQASCNELVGGEPVRWQREWEVQCEHRRQQRLRRGAILALSLIAEPSALDWNEVFMDVTWSAWAEIAADARRSRELPEAQRHFELQAETHAVRPSFEPVGATEELTP